MRSFDLEDEKMGSLHLVAVGADDSLSYFTSESDRNRIGCFCALRFDACGRLLCRAMVNDCRKRPASVH